MKKKYNRYLFYLGTALIISNLYISLSFGQDFHAFENKNPIHPMQPELFEQNISLNKNSPVLFLPPPDAGDDDTPVGVTGDAETRISLFFILAGLYITYIKLQKIKNHRL